MKGIVADAKAFVVKFPRLRYWLSRGVERLVDLARVPPPGLRGVVYDGRAADRLPVVLLFQPGADESGVANTLAAVPELSSAAGVRVVLVLDRAHLAVARRAGVVAELVPDCTTWERRHGVLTWTGHLAHQLAILRRDYAATAIHVLPHDGLDILDRSILVAALLSDPAAHRAASRWRRSRTALVRLVDRPASRQPRAEQPSPDGE